MRLIGLFSTLLLLLFAWSGTRAYSGDEYDDIRIIRSDRNGVVFTYLVPEPEKSQVSLGEDLFDLFNFDKCGLTNQAGGYQLPVRRVIIAVPPEGEVAVEVLDVTATDLPGINLAPAAKVEPDEQSPLGYRAVPWRTERKSVQWYPQEIVASGSPVWLRNQRTVELEISPVQYDPALRRARLCSQITVSVGFQGSGEAVPQNQRDLFEGIYRNVLLNYDQSLGWRKVAEQPGLRKPTVPYPFGYSDNWYKVIVRENGIYRMDRAMLVQSGVPVGSLDPRTIRMFSGGGKILPLDNSNPFLELHEIAIFVSGEQDGSFDSDDFILFYGWSPNDWDYDSGGSAIGFHTNPFTNDNVLWLTFDPVDSFLGNPKRMAVKDGSPVEENPIRPAEFASRIHAEQDNTLRIYSSGLVADYYNWYWTNVNPARLYVSLPGALPEEGCLIRVKHTQSPTELLVNGQPAQIIDSLSSNSVTVARSFDLQGGMLDTLEIWLSGQSDSYLDWYEVEYQRLFECHDRQLLFESPNASGIAEYSISGLYSPNASLFDVTDYADVQRISGIQVEGETARFQDALDPEGRRRYLLTTAG
jgi:hypothetical protein